MDFHADPFANAELVDVRAKSGDRAHIFMARRKVLVEGQTTLNAGRRARMDDLKVSRADRDRIDPDQDFRACRNGHRLATPREADRAVPNTSLHLVRES